VQALQRLVLTAAVVELLIGLGAFAMGGPLAAAATLVGSGVAFGAQLAAVALLLPAMQSDTRRFAQRWAIGMAIRFGSFIMVAAVILAAKTVLPPAWVAAGYLSMMLVLLALETRYLK